MSDSVLSSVFDGVFSVLSSAAAGHRRSRTRWTTRNPPIPSCRRRRTRSTRFPSRSSFQTPSQSRPNRTDTSDPWSPKDWLAVTGYAHAIRPNIAPSRRHRHHHPAGGGRTPSFPYWTSATPSPALPL